MTSFLVVSLLLGIPTQRPAGLINQAVPNVVRVPQNSTQSQGGSGGGAAGELGKATSPLVRGTAIQRETWDSVKKSIAFLPDSMGKPFGLAVLIDNQGFFMAHSSAIISEPLTATLEDGSNIRLGRIGYDRTTQLVLLGAQNWTQSSRQTISVADPDYPATDMTMITVDGPVRSTMSNKNVPGLVQTTNRYLPLSEVQFESLTIPLGGALMFNRNGQLLGVLGATIQKAESVTTTIPANNFGPQGMTIGYALSPKILRRVVAGFQTPDHKVHHPNIGILFKDNPITGAVITQVNPDSPAAKAGIQSGDLILKFDSQQVKNALDLATRLFSKDPGETVILNIDRSGRPLQIKLVVEGIDVTSN